MPPPIPVVLAKYNPDWPDRAAKYANALSKALGENLSAVHHIGSTAVPGLIAKPIIDLLPVVHSLLRLDAARAGIEAIGYEWHGEFGISGRRFCTLSDTSGTRIVNAHFFEGGSSDIERHLAFRDYLIAHPALASAYAWEKQRAASLHQDNSHDYTDEKGAWVRKTEADALNWVRSC